MDGSPKLDRIGDAPKRREDARFVTGQGRYLDDLAFDGLVHAIFVRSPHAHAEVRGVDVAAAKAMPGVLAVLTAADVAAAGLKPLEPFVKANTQTGDPFNWDTQPLLAGEKVRFVGEPVAMVVAETKHQAMDAAEAVVVDYGDLPAVVDARAALAPGAVELSSDVPGNLAVDWKTGDWPGADAGFAAAAHVAEVDLLNHRIVSNPIEPRGGVGVWDPASRRYTLHVSSQNVHGNRDYIARALGEKRENVRWIAPDVGGGFGAKNFAYVEQALLLWAAKATGRPVKWMATRQETFLADHQARDHLAKARLALDGEGAILALEIESVANLGAYMAGSAGGVQTFQYAHLPGAVYRVPATALRVRAALTNTAPIGVFRGPGFGEMVNILERLIDEAARVSGLDRFDIRRRNLLPKAAMPATNPFGNTIDSGDFPKAFERALELADVAGFPARRAASSERLGIAATCHIKATGGSPDENVEIKFREDGGVDLVTGTQTIGQSHETTFPQLVADRLGIPNDLVRLVHGDTDAIPFGGGHGSSRATYMAGTAIWRASEEIVAKGKRIASDLLEVAGGDLEFVDGRYRIIGTDRAVELLEVAAEARRRGESLDAYHFWTRAAMTYPNGTHVAEVAVDPATGVARLLRYTAVDDYGVVVNPMVVLGQAHGAIAQGVGQALLEHAVYGAGDGQLIAGSFMDYAMPRADDLADFQVEFSSVPCTTNPFGVKGCGEPGAIAGYPAVTLAILDALGGDAKAWRGAATPEAVWRAMP